MSRIVKRVSTAIASQHHEYIKFPNRDGPSSEKQKFKEIGGIPGVVGAIDCTHIKIISPDAQAEFSIFQYSSVGTRRAHGVEITPYRRRCEVIVLHGGGPNAELYRNRKGYFSINVQAVMDSDLKFTNIVARWPGSVHDSRIFQSSRLCGQLENGDIQGILLGDSGYAIKPYLLTPTLKPGTAPERRYNYAQCRMRNTIERLFGVWERRFACLATGMRIKIGTVLIVIIATTVLHNIARLHGETIEDEIDDENTDDQDHDDDDGESLQCIMETGWG